MLVGSGHCPPGHSAARRRELDELGREGMTIVVGGVTPEQDFEALRANGAHALYPRGTVIPVGARELPDKLHDQVDPGADQSA